MDSPVYNGEPGAMPYDREHDPRPAHDEPRVFACRDCGTRGTEGYKSMPIEGLGYISCDACWRERTAHG